MKFLKVLKKPIFIAALFAVMALTALATVTASAENQDFGGSVKGYQVSMQGRINLKFYYNDVDADMDDDDCYVAEIVGTEKTYTYPVSKIKDKNVISVPLAPSEMGYTVKITPVKVDGETRTESTKTVEYSVLKYAKAVLADQENAAYHNAMRALLNWGAKSQSYYYDAPAELVNVGIYSRNTNPISAVTTTTIKAPAHTVTSSDAGSFTVVGSELDLALSEGNVSLRFYIKSSNTTAATLDATIARAGLDTQNVKAVRVGDTYLVQIDSITANLFNSLYTVTISDGSDTFTTQGSVLEYLNKIVNGESKETVKKDEQIAVAQSLYQFYQLATGNTGAASCWHGKTIAKENINYFSIPSEFTGKSYYMCSHCFSSRGNGAIGNDVDHFISAELLFRAQELGGTMDETYLKDTDGKAYANYKNMTVNSGGTMEYEIVRSDEGINARYLVFKIRLGKNNETQRPNETTMYTRFFFNTYSTNISNSVEYQQIDFAIANDGEWHTVVYDLGQHTDKGFDAETGIGSIKFLVLRPFAIQWYKDSDGVMHPAPTAESEMDLQYISLCDKLEDLEGVIDTDLCSVYTTSTSFTNHVTSSLVRDNEIAKTVEMYVPAEKLPDIYKTDDIKTEYYIDESGSYIRYSDMQVGTDNWMGYNFISNSGNAVNGRYLVFKIRLGENNASLNKDYPNLLTRFYVGASGGTENAQIDFTVANDYQWHTIVYDLSKNMTVAGYDANTGIGSITYMQLRPFCVQWYKDDNGAYHPSPTEDTFMDLGYIALCDELSELQTVIDTDTYDLYTASTTFKTLDTSRIMIDEHVEMYLSSDDLYGLEAGSGSMHKELLTDAGKKYVRYDKLTLLDNKPLVAYSVYQNSSKSVEARYLVMKIKMGKDNSSYHAQMTTRFIVNTTDTGLGKITQVDFNIPKEDQWYTVVYDLSKSTGDAMFDSETGIGGIKLLQLRPFCQQWYKVENSYFAAPTAESRMDIQYLALCDNISDLQYIIDTDTYCWFTNSDSYEVRNTSDNSAVSAE